MEMKDERFEKIRRGLYEELLKANLHFKIFWAIHTASKDIADIRNAYLSFFVLTMRSHNDRFCIAIHNIVNHKKDTANFTKLFDYIKSTPNLQNIFDLKKIDEMDNTIRSYAHLTKRIAVIRDQYIAHNQLTKKHLSGETTYTYEEGKNLLLDMNNILEEISKKYDGSLYWTDNTGLMEVSPCINVENMLRNLTEFKKAKLIRRRAQTMKGAK